MSKLGNVLIATGLAIGWIGCGDEIHYHGSDAAKGDPGVAGPNGGKGDTGAMGAPGAPATTNDGCNNTNTMGCFRPIGTLQGVIYDAYDRRPIANAKVIINYNGTAQTVTTDASGTYAFTNLPATAAGGLSHPTIGGVTGAVWTGAYSVVLDLSTPGVADTDHHYRAYQERKAQVVFTDLGDGESANGSDQNTDTRVDGLVANLDFPIRQTRAAASGKVYNAETRAPMANVGLVVAYALATDQETVGQVAASTMTDAMGGYMVTGIEEGATYRLTPTDTRFGFAAAAANGTTYAGTPFYAPENGVVLVLADILLQDRAGRDAVPPFIVSSSPKDNDILVSGADLAQSITMTFSEAMDQSQNANLATHLYLGLETNFDITGINPGNRSFPCLQVGTGPLAGGAPANGNPGNNWTATGGNINAATKCATLLEVFTINTWDATGKILTVDPQINFNAGLAFAYRLDVINTHVRDLAGNARTGCLPASSTSQNGDAFNIEDTAGGCAAGALPAGNAPDSSVFTFQAGAQPLPVANAAQEPDTSDAIVPTTAPLIVRTPTAVRSTAATFLGRQGLGFYTNTNIQAGPLGTTDDLFVSWDPSAGAVGYVIYYKDPFYPNYQPLQMISTQSPNRLGYATNLATINAALALVYGAGGAGTNTTFLPIDTNWLIGRTGLGVQATLGISAVNADGIEGPIADVAIHDDTTPEVCRGGVGPVAGTNGNCLNIAFGGGTIALGADWNYSTGAVSTTLAANGIVLNDTENDFCLGGDNPLAPGALAYAPANVGMGRIACIQAPQPNNYGVLTAPGFGERIIVLELSEPVAVTELTVAKVRFVPGSVTNAAFGGNPNGTGATADQAASITAVGPFFLPTVPPSAFTKFVAVKFANAFSINSGDTVVIGDGTAAASVADLAGNLATPARSSHTGAPVGAPAAAATDAPGIRFIDNQSPYLRNVTVDPVADTVTVKFTKRIFQDPAGTGPAGVADIAPGAPNAGGTYERSLVSFTNNAAVAAAPYAALLPGTYVAQGFFPVGTTFHQGNATSTLTARATYTAVASGDTVTFQYGDVSWLNHGGSVLLNGVRNADFFSAISDTVGAGSRAKNFVDRGFQAFFNIPVDTAAAPLGVGPYGPLTAGVGTLVMADTVPARLSLFDAHRALAVTSGPGVSGNEWTVACTGGAAAPTSPFYVDVIITDTQAPAIANDATNAASMQNFANWTIALRDFGACGGAGGQAACNTIGWTGALTGTNGASPGSFTFAAALTANSNTVACNGDGNADGNNAGGGAAGDYQNLNQLAGEGPVPATPAGGSVCRIRFGLTLPNTLTPADNSAPSGGQAGCGDNNPVVAAVTPNSRKLGVDSVAMGAAVTDARGNATSTHNQWSYSLNRTGAVAITNPATTGWTRN